MRFIINHDGKTEQRVLKYEIAELSFDTNPSVLEVDFTLVLNKLNLSVVGKKVVQVWGYSPFQNWESTSYDVPEYRQGELRIEGDLESGFSYGISDDEWPVYVNERTGWISIGNLEESCDAVEFVRNCVAVIGENSELVSLWLKPHNLPLPLRAPKGRI